jgi:hypothetical protein
VRTTRRVLLPSVWDDGSGVLLAAVANGLMDTVNGPGVAADFAILALSGAASSGAFHASLDLSLRLCDKDRSSWNGGQLPTAACT